MLKLVLFWGVWLTVPILLEGIKSAVYFIRAMYFVIFRKVPALPRKHNLPLVTILVPCYNSEETLKACLESIMKQTYLSMGDIEVLVVNNGSTDNSAQVFRNLTAKIQEPKRLQLYWHEAPTAGKAKALNIGIYQANGEIVISLDSDTLMEKNATEKLVRRYLASGSGVVAVGGSVLIDFKQISKEFSLMQLLNLAEMYEYLEAFLVGRVASSMTNSVYTLAGAFSSFKKEALLKTMLYHQQSIAEDTFLTFEIKRLGTVLFESEAVVYTEPIPSLEKLALQRFRWQRGQMEIAFRYKDKHIGRLKDISRNFVMATIFMDHTLMFSRTVWLFLIFLLYIWGYPLKVFLGANLFMYGMYLLIDLMYLIPAVALLPTKEYKSFVLKHSYIILAMPIYRFILYIVRLQGIIDGIMKKPNWRAMTVQEEFLRGYLRLKRKIKLSWDLWHINGKM